jgi:ATP-dependent DNA ligase
MNRFAALIDRLALAADTNAKRRLLADYLSCSSEPDRSAAAAVLAGTRNWRRVSLNFIRGIAEPRLDPALFALSLAHVGDPAETIALLWPQRPGANRDPSLPEIVEALSTLGKSELPKRLETWLDAADASGRWALIKLVTGTLTSPVTAAEVGHALMAAGIDFETGEAVPATPQTQNEMFDLPRGGASATPGRIDAVLLYVERGRTKTSPLVCTFGVWSGDALVPAGKAALDACSVVADRIEGFVRDHTINRFGPVREVAHAREVGLVLGVVFDGLERTRRRKAGVILQNPRIDGVNVDRTPAHAATLATLEQLL